MVQAEEWDKALAVAPAVSHKYWRSLMKQKANWRLSQSDCVNRDISCLLLPSNFSEYLIEVLVKNGQYEQAFITAVHQNNG